MRKKDISGCQIIQPNWSTTIDNRLVYLERFIFCILLFEKKTFFHYKQDYFLKVIVITCFGLSLT